MAISIHPSRVGWDSKEYQALIAGAISIHPSRVGWDVESSPLLASYKYFNPPIPCGMGHDLVFFSPVERLISIHPSRVGWDKSPASFAAAVGDFNPPIPCGMGRQKIFKPLLKLLFQSTHPVWDGTSEIPYV